MSKWSPLFWIVVVILSMAVPLAAVINSFITGLEATPQALLYTAIFSGLVSDLTTRYLTLRFGLYSPLVPSQG